MKRSLLFIIVVFALALSACGPKVEENAISNLQVKNNSVEYDLGMYLNRPNRIAMVDLNFVTVSAPEGTELGYRVNNEGKVDSTGNGTRYLTLTLVSGPADIDVFVTKCPYNNCPAEKVHFEHTHLYP